MPVRIVSAGGGGVTLSAASTGSEFTLTLPAATSTLVTTASLPAAPQLQDQLFTTSGTWTVPAGVTRARVTVIGGGGGGAAWSASTNGQPGGGGGIAIGIFTVTPGSSIVVTIGAGGVGGLGNTNVGTSGASSSFGAFLSATGGSGGNFVSFTNGAGTGGTIRNNSVTLTNPGYFSGINRTAGTGTAAVAFSIGGTNGAGYGGAGGDAAGSVSGGGGVNGIVYIEWVG